MKLKTFRQWLLVGGSMLLLGGCSLLGGSSTSGDAESAESAQPTAQPFLDDPAAEAEMIEQELMELDTEKDFQSFSQEDLTE